MPVAECAVVAAEAAAVAVPVSDEAESTELETCEN
jgi:hypothetical protein